MSWCEFSITHFSVVSVYTINIYACVATSVPCTSVRTCLLNNTQIECFLPTCDVWAESDFTAFLGRAPIIYFISLIPVLSPSSWIVSHSLCIWWLCYHGVCAALSTIHALLFITLRPLRGFRQSKPTALLILRYIHNNAMEWRKLLFVWL